MSGYCLLHAELGRFEVCPGEDCPLWEDGSCTVQRLRIELGGRTEVARYLLELRRQLELSASK